MSHHNLDKNFTECILLNYELSVMEKMEKVMKKVIEEANVQQQYTLVQNGEHMT